MRLHVLICLLFFCMLGVSHAATLAIPSFELTENDQFSVTITLADVVEVVGAQFSVAFDADLVNITGIREATFLNESGGVSTFALYERNESDLQAHSLIVIRLSSNVSGTGTLAFMDGVARSNGDTTLNLTAVSVAYGNNSAVDLVLINSSLTINATAGVVSPPTSPSPTSPPSSDSDGDDTSSDTGSGGGSLPPRFDTPTPEVITYPEIGLIKISEGMYRGALSGVVAHGDIATFSAGEQLPGVFTVIDSTTGQEYEAVLVPNSDSSYTVTEVEAQPLTVPDVVEKIQEATVEPIKEKAEDFKELKEEDPEKFDAFILLFYFFGAIATLSVGFYLIFRNIHSHRSVYQRFPTMVVLRDTKKIKEYLRAHANVSRSTLTSELIQVGWDKELIDEAYRTLNSEE